MDTPKDDWSSGMKAFVSGWGAGFSQCDSDLVGPSPHAICKFPFRYNGRTYKKCARIPPPSNDNKVCKQFLHWAEEHKPEGFDQTDSDQVYSIFLWDDEIHKARVTTCYPAKSSRYGWCGTCYPDDLTPGQEGYCDKYHGGTETGSLEEMAKPTPDTHWGTCSKWCHNPMGPAASQNLQEAQLDILSPQACADFGSDLEANASLEICTGHKSNFRYIWQFRRVVHNKGEIAFHPEGKVLNMLGLAKSKYPFFLGGKDSCQGM